MADYIDREVVLDTLKMRIDHWPESRYQYESEKFGLEIACAIVKDCPSADVQPVVKCKDCKWCVDADGLMCKNVKSWVVATESDYGCVVGERRTEGQ